MRELASNRPCCWILFSGGWLSDYILTRRGYKACADNREVDAALAQGYVDFFAQEVLASGWERVQKGAAFFLSDAL